jgi:hypothetical protein
MADKGSMIDRLRAQREQAMKRDKSLTLEVPGWSGLLHVRYKPVEWERLYALVTQAADMDASAALADNLDALVSACDSLRVRPAADEYPDLERDEKGLVSLADTLRAQEESVHGEVCFDETAVDVLGLKVPNPVGELRRPKDNSETCLAIFAGAVSPELAIGDHAGRLAAWMRGVEQEVDSDLLGG